MKFTHPEKRDDECYLTNSNNNGEEVGWKSKRIGKIAYSREGEVIKGYVPVFINKEEIKNALGYECEDL